MNRLLREKDQEGAVAVTTAILLVILILFAALIVDLGRLRVDRSADQLVADSAVTAAGLTLPGDGAEAACLDGMTYALRNLPLSEAQIVAALADATAACNGAFDPSTFSCDPDAADPLAEQEVASIPVAEYTIVVTHPVADASELMSYQTHVASDPKDGKLCDRIGVAVTRQADYTLAGVAGFKGSQTTVSAVSFAFVAGSSDIFASLVVLDRTGCQTLRANGANAEIDVQSITIGSKTYPGTITVDSAPSSCSPNDRVFDPDGGSARIHADGDIWSFGLSIAGSPTETAAIYNPSDVPTKLDPEPTDGELITRSPIDRRYNCTAYGSGSEPYLPDGSYLPDTFDHPGIADCDGSRDGDGGPYIEELYDHVSDGITTPTFTATNGYRLFPGPSEQCNNVNLTDSTATRWYFNCDTVRVRNGSTLTLQNADLVVFKGGVDVDGGGTFYVNTTDGTSRLDKDTTLVLWSGDMDIQGDLVLINTFAYLNDGRVNKTGGGTLVTVAPLGAGDSTPEPCGDLSETSPGTGTWPSSGCFEDLAIWQNGYGTGPSDTLNLGGNGFLQVEGTVFGPNAKVNVAGNAASDLADAQFFGWSFEYSGLGALTLIPNPDRATPVPIFGIGLIR